MHCVCLFSFWFQPVCSRGSPVSQTSNLLKPWHAGPWHPPKAANGLSRIQKTTTTAGPSNGEDWWAKTRNQIWDWLTTAPWITRNAEDGTTQRCNLSCNLSPFQTSSRFSGSFASMLQPLGGSDLGPLIDQHWLRPRTSHRPHWLRPRTSHRPALVQTSDLSSTRTGSDLRPLIDQHWLRPQTSHGPALVQT